MATLIRKHSRPGDLVVDPFAGSGTTGVAALREGRRFAGCEPILLQAIRQLKQSGNSWLTDTCQAA
jgi:DNA modification methylase